MAGSNQQSLYSPAELAYMSLMHARYGDSITKSQREEMEARLEEIKRIQVDPFYNLEGEANEKA